MLYIELKLKIIHN